MKVLFMLIIIFRKGLKNFRLKLIVLVMCRFLVDDYEDLKDWNESYV